MAQFGVSPKTSSRQMPDGQDRMKHFSDKKIGLLNYDYRANSLRSRDLLPLLMGDLLENLQLPLDLKSIDPTVSRRL